MTRKSPNAKVFIHEMTYQCNLEEGFPFQLYRTVKFVFWIADIFYQIMFFQTWIFLGGNLEELWGLNFDK